MTKEELIAALAKIGTPDWIAEHGKDNDKAHSDADSLLLDFLGEDVEKAFWRASGRITFWYA